MERQRPCRLVLLHDRLVTESLLGKVAKNSFAIKQKPPSGIIPESGFKVVAMLSRSLNLTHYSTVNS